jgi:hypothetical protein
VDGSIFRETKLLSPGNNVKKPIYFRLKRVPPAQSPRVLFSLYASRFSAGSARRVINVCSFVALAWAKLNEVKNLPVTQSMENFMAAGRSGRCN